MPVCTAYVIRLYKCIKCLISRGFKASKTYIKDYWLQADEKNIYIVKTQNNMGAIKIEIDSSVSLIQIIVNI